MHRHVFALALALGTMGAITHHTAPAEAATGDIELANANPQAVALLNDFMTALAIPDADASAKECMKYVHKSMLNPGKTDLTTDLRNFGFKKAHDNAKFYASPVKLTRIRPTAMTGIGAQVNNTAELGTVHDYYIAKKDGVQGMPAPVKIFFPKSGGPAKISYMGSI